MIKKFLAAVAMTMAAAFSVRAAGPTAAADMTDAAVRSTRLIHFGSGEAQPLDSAYALIARFYTDQFRHTQDPLAPYFLFMSKGSDLAMGIGGCVRMRGYFDWGGAVTSPGFSPWMIPMTKNPLSMRQLGTTPAGTSLFFRVIGTNRTLGEYQVYIEANFNGYSSRDFHLKKAYAQIRDWTIGYAASTFSDPMALPSIVDASGPNCKMSQTAVLVRWNRQFRKGWSLAASVESPSHVGIEADGVHTEPLTQFVPDGSAFVQYQNTRWGHLRLAGIVRSLAYRNLSEDRNHYRAGWGLQLSGKFTPAYALTFYGAFNGGKGYAGLGGDWLMGNYDLIPRTSADTKLYAPAAFGGYIAAQYNFRPNLFASATFSATRYCPEGKQDPDEYKQGLYMAVNIFWNLTPRIQAAAEFDLGRRMNFSGQTAWARRAGLLAQFSF